MMNVTNRTCPYCGKIFSRVFNLQRHLKNNSCKEKVQRETESEENLSQDTEPNSIESESSSEIDQSSAEDSSESGEDQSESESERVNEPEEQHWKVLVDESTERHKGDYSTLVQEFLEQDETEEDAKILAHNQLIPVYQKELRKVLLEKIKWMRQFRHDPYFKKILDTRRDIMERNGDYDWEEATESAIRERKFLLNKLLAPKKRKRHSETDEELSEGFD